MDFKIKQNIFDCLLNDSGNPLQNSNDASYKLVFHRSLMVKREIS